MFNFKIALRSALFVLVTVSLVSGQAWAQALFPIKGGTGTEPDPKDKGYLVLVAENSDLKITFRHSDKFRPKKGDIWAFFMKIENKTDKPLTFDPTKFGSTDDEGRALSGLEASVVIERIYAAFAGMGVLVSGVIVGPFLGPAMAQASERSAKQRIMQMCIQSGEIPPHTFKDGLVFFDKATKKTKELKANFTGLWSEPIYFATEEKRRLRVAK